MNTNFILFALCIGWSVDARASTIVFSNLQGNALQCGCDLGQGEGVGTWSLDPTEHVTLGNSFITPSTSNFTLDSIELAVGLIEGNANALTVSLYTDENGSPGLLMEAFQIDNQMGVFGRDNPLLIAGSTVHPSLAAGSQYWLLATTTATTGTYAGWYSNNSGDMGLVGAQIQRDDFGNTVIPFCCIRNDLRNAFAILGTPIQAIPEPSMFWLLASGLPFVCVKASRRSAILPRLAADGAARANEVRPGGQVG